LRALFLIALALKTTVTSGGEAQAVNINSGTNSTAAGPVFSLDTKTITSGGDAQAISIARGNQTIATGSVISLNTEIYDGFVINGAYRGDQSGFSVSGAGDVNGDGLDDVIVGAPRSSPNGLYSGATGASTNSLYSGQSTVVFGKADGTAVELSVV
jgi:hypothetical protein